MCPFRCFLLVPCLGPQINLKIFMNGLIESHPMNDGQGSKRDEKECGTLNNKLIIVKMSRNRFFSCSWWILPPTSSPRFASSCFAVSQVSTFSFIIFMFFCFAVLLLMFSLLLHVSPPTFQELLRWLSCRRWRKL